MPDRVKITLPDGSVKEAPRSIRIVDFVRESIGPGLAKAAYVAKLEGQSVDLARTIDNDARLEIVTTKNPEALEVARRGARDGEQGGDREGHRRQGGQDPDARGQAPEHRRGFGGEEPQPDTLRLVPGSSRGAALAK